MAMVNLILMKLILLNTSVMEILVIKVTLEHKVIMVNLL